MAVMASGQITLVDVNDSKQLQLYIKSSQPKTQIYNPDNSSYTPSWTTNKPVLTPELFIAGTSNDIIADASSVKWFVDGVELTASTTDYTLGTNPKTLTVNTNVLATDPAKLFSCEIVYRDTGTGFDITAKADIEFVLVSSGAKGATGAKGADAVRAVVWTPDGNVIKNGTGTLKAKCDVYSGSTVVTATAYQWYLQDPAQSTDVGGGVGWKKLDGTFNMGTTGYTSATLNIPASAVLGVESFKCVATYSAVAYSDVCTVSDVSDPIQVTVVGTSVFKNGQGSTALTAKLYQAGAEIDSVGSQFIYTWSLYDSANVKQAGFSKTGKSITVLATEVDVRGNIVCEVSS